MSDSVNRYDITKTLVKQVGLNQKPPSGSNAAKSETESGNSFRELLDRRLGSDVMLSKHADMRAKERNIAIGEGEMGMLSDACDKASQKGIRDALIVMNDSAFIVNAGSKVVVTVVDKNELKGNIFTNIEGAVFL
ncbi:MAG: flagellar biosynthesis protein [Clostridiales Family XIII bacterium]|jgi:flagellar operon protein|nr:flagellar biosynthesis protein [Clostridiales Family XIII bacterium]